MNKPPIIQIIVELVTEFEEHPYFINCGLCYDFADKVQDRMRTHNFHIDIFEISWDCTWPEHAFIYFQGKYYDAEEPMGVKNWWQLPIFLRVKQKGRRPIPQQCA
jgi:hypothetical protein